MTRPNWRNEEEYAFTDTLTRDGWAWQFLSRSDDYIKYWNSKVESYLANEEKMALHEKLTKNIFPVRPPARLDAHPQYFPISSECSEKEKESLDADRKVTYELCYIPCPGAGQKWGFYFDELYNPYIIEPLSHTDEIYIEYFTDPVRTTHGKLPIFFDSLPWPTTDGDPREGFETFKITIDYRKSIPQQFKKLNEYCERRKLAFERASSNNTEEGEINFKPRSWKKYLRVLDGKADGKKYGEIEVFVHDVNARDAYRQAQDLIKRYRKILLPTPHNIATTS
jgi:hypothetical protein